MIELTSDSFRHVVNKSWYPVVVFFHKPGCTSCTAVHHQMAELERRYPHGVAFHGVNTATEGTSTVGYWSTGVPLVVLFKDGLEVWRWRGGSVTADKIGEEIDLLLPGSTT